MTDKPKGSLMIIGGHEDKKGEEIILSEVAKYVKDGSLVLIPAASSEPEKMVQDYEKAFGRLGVKKIEVVNPATREDSKHPDNVEKIKRAAVVFMTGGDQLRLTSLIGDSPVFQELVRLYHDRGGLIAGTSAGAAAMSEVMLIAGGNSGSTSVEEISMAPGFKLLPGTVVDSHFAQRGRISRLFTAVSQNPKNIGLGIDENTAILVNGQERFRVMGEFGVYVVDGTDMTFSSLSEDNAFAEDLVTMFDIKVHVLGDGYEFDLKKRRPVPAAEDAKEATGKRSQAAADS